MFTTRVRLLAQQALKPSRPIFPSSKQQTPKPSRPIFPPTKILEDLLHQHGPQNLENCWKLAEPAGIKSKTRMKAFLVWLVERRRIRLICHHIKDNCGPHGAKEFLYGPPKERTKKVSDTVAAKLEVQENDTVAAKLEVQENAE